MPTRLKMRTKVFLGVGAVGAILIVLVPVLTPWIRMNELRSACASTDRMVIDVFPFKNASGSRTEVDRLQPYQFIGRDYEIKGREKVVEFLDTIQLAPTIPGVMCRCLGELSIEIYSGETRVAVLRPKNDDEIAWWKGPWSGDSNMTTTSVERMTDFLTRNGCPTPAERSAELADYHAEILREAREYLSKSEPDDADNSDGSDSTSEGPGK